MRPVLLLCVLLALFGLSAGWLLRPVADDEDAISDGGPCEEAGDATVEAPVLQGHGRPARVDVAATHGALFGTVRDRTGHVAADVEVWRIAKAPPASAGAPVLISSWSPPQAARPEPELVRRTQTDAAGTFRIQDLPSATYRVVARSATGAYGAATAVVRRRTTAEAHVQVHPGTEQLEGRVRWEDGRPWAGRVHVVLGGDRERETGPLPGDRPGVETDAAGRFVVTGLQRGFHGVHAFGAHGLHVFDSTVWLPHDGPYELVVKENPEPIVGRVVSDDGARALPRALVRAACRGSIRTMETDWQGRFRIGWNGGYATLTVEAAGHTPAEQVVREATPTDLMIVLSRNGGLSGRVVQDETDEPVGGIAIVTDKELSTTSDGDGVFSLHGVAAGKVAIAARGGGWVTVAGDGLAREGRVVQVTPGRSTMVVLRVRRAASVQGRVLGPDGVGIAGARIDAWSVPQEDRDPWLPGRESWSDPWRTDRSTSMPPLLAVTDAEGRFLLDALALRVEYRVRAHAVGFAPASTQVRRTELSGEELTLRLGRDRWIDVRVIHEDGGAPPVAEVQLQRREGGTTVARETTDEGGRVRLGPLGSESLSVRVWSPKFISARRTLAPDERGPIEIRMHRARPVTGTVEFVDGKPASSIHVDIVGLDVNDRTEMDGSFRIWGVPAGTWVLRAGSRRDLTRLNIRGGDEGLRVTLPCESRAERPNKRAARPTVTLQVCGWDGLPIPSADVRSGGSCAGTVRNGSVRVRATSRPLVVLNARSSSGALLPYGPVGVGPFEEGTDEIEVSLPPGEQTTGRILDLEGRPVADAEVTAYMTVQGSPCGGSLESLSDGEGNFRIGGLGEGTVRLHVGPPAGYFAPPATTVPAGACGVIFRLRHAPLVVVTVLGPDGAGLAGARVRCRPLPGSDAETESGWLLSTRTVNSRADANGKAPLHHLDPEQTYHVRVSPPGGSTHLHAIVLEDWVPADATVALRPGLVVDGTVTDAQGRPLAGLLVTASSNPGATKRGRSDRNGRFELGPLPRSDVRVSASTRGGRLSQIGPVVEERTSPTLVVPAGTRGIELRVPAGIAVTVRIEDWDSYLTDDHHVGWLYEEETGTQDTEDEETRPHARAYVDENGFVSFRHADPEKSYTFWLAPLEDGRHAYRQGIRPGGREIRVRLEDGRTIRGQVRVPARAKYASTIARRGRVKVTGRVHRNGRYEIRGLPAGTWEVVASARHWIGQKGYRLEASGTVDAGGTIDLDLGPR